MKPVCWTNMVLVIFDNYLKILIDNYSIDYDDNLKRNQLIYLNFSYYVLLSDSIELDRMATKCNHHVLHNVIVDDAILDSDDQPNDLNLKAVFVEKYLLLV